MAYYILQDFAAGLDRRKSAITSKAGSLRELTNGFVNAGGEIEKRYKLSQIGTITASDTHGLAFHENQLYVFGFAATATGLPASVSYQQLTLDTPGPDLTQILRTETFGDQLYVVALLSNGATAHFLDGTQVTDTALKGPFARAYKEKMFVTDERNLKFSAIGRADVFDPENTAGASDANLPGAGIIDMKQVDGSGGDLMAVVPYYSFLAVLSRTAVQVWAMDPDPALSEQIQTLGSTGLIAHNAAARYGNGDVLFLADTGIRSIRARDSSNAAVLNDIGSPIDDLIVDKRIAEFTSPTDKIYADADPLSGHFWMAWGQDAYVLAYYPASKVSAWSRFRFPVSIDYLARGSSRLFLRAGNQIYVYGAIALGGDPLDDSGGFPPKTDWYDDSEITITTPMLDVGDPAGQKSWQGLDIACEGVWNISVAPDPLQPDVFTPVGVLKNTSYSQGRVGLGHQSSHLAVKLTSTSPNARLGAVAVHYRAGKSD